MKSDIPYHKCISDGKHYLASDLDFNVEEFGEEVNFPTKSEEVTKLILDACCGSRSFWNNKNNPLTMFMDIRRERLELCDGRTIEVNPDVVADFRCMPFPDDTFRLVVFDPPHLRWCGDSSYMRAKYGRLTKDYRKDITQGLAECWRVLQPFGILVFKWNEEQIKVAPILKQFSREPLFGHITGRSGKTRWYCFMKTDE